MNTYCGPFALGYLLGITPDEAAALIREDRQQRQYRFGQANLWGGRPKQLTVRGVYNHEMVRILENHTHIQQRTGYYVPKPTLAAWLKGKSGLWLVNVTSHYVVLDGRKLYDNGHREGVPLREWKKRRVRVGQAWQIQRA
jgi:hypothetical protein